MDMSTVYICQESFRKEGGRLIPRDFTSAENFGPVQFVLRWSETKVIYERADSLLWKIRDALRFFTAEDYIIPVGDPTVIQLVGIVAAEMSDGRYRVLQWDNKLHRYDTIAVDIHCQPPREELSKWPSLERFPPLRKLS